MGGKKASRSRDMLSNLDSRVTKLKGSMGDVRETLKEVEGCTTELKSRHDQLKGEVIRALNANVVTVQGIFNTIVELHTA
ncbi:hypothetical protein GOBAR_AA21316 [Gossypium barbadense]|uniref:Uncharacterized protein n=1 Tax=Gossypium barbadense TaxID=3634 RepID=A0A2P5X7P9_GOSBA|nr:hypothetical protein GOBAR_AA21316 [Gossypium barbadense]